MVFEPLSVQIFKNSMHSFSTMFVYICYLFGLFQFAPGKKSSFGLLHTVPILSELNLPTFK